MIKLSKRELLLALAASGVLGADAAHAQGGCASLELSAGREIGAAWRAAHPDANLAALRAELLADGACADLIAELGARARADFRSGAVFTHRGWRLSETEARLFALLDGG